MVWHSLSLPLRSFSRSLPHPMLMPGLGVNGAGGPCRVCRSRAPVYNAMPLATAGIGIRAGSALHDPE